MPELIKRPLVILGVMVCLAPLPTPAFSEDEPTGIACDGKAALFTDGSAFKLWVVRRGTMVEANPLRPLSQEPLLVIQVVVNGRSATAYGPDAANLRQGGPPAQLEQGGGQPIQWEDGSRAPPATLRIRAEDGRVLFERLAFSGCEDAPALRTPPRPKPEPRRRAGQDGQEVTRPARALPQGAIP